MALVEDIQTNVTSPVKQKRVTLSARVYRNGKRKVDTYVLLLQLM